MGGGGARGGPPRPQRAGAARCACAGRAGGKAVLGRGRELRAEAPPHWPVGARSQWEGREGRGSGPWGARAAPAAGP